MDEAPLSASPPSRHAIRFFEQEESLVYLVGEFIGEGLLAGRPGIVIASPSVRAAIIQQLLDRTFDVVEFQRAGDLVFLDAEETMASFMPQGNVDPNAFTRRMTALLKKVCPNGADRAIHISGQGVDILWKSGLREAAIQIEGLWNQLAQTMRFSLLCGYPLSNFDKDVDMHHLRQLHTHVISADGVATSTSGR